MPGGKEPFCRFGAARIRPRIRAFAAEIEGVRSGVDPEAVHRMRVASRRLRSALPLFPSCFAPREVKRWTRDLRGITRALGTARDTDVQLAFLDGYLRDLPDGRPGIGAIRRVRASLQTRREVEQATVLSALAALEAAGTLDRIAAAAGALRGGGGGEYGAGPAAAGFAAGQIAAALDALLAFGPVVNDPADTEGHHAMRIAAKKLRYTLEVFRPLAPGRFRPFLRRIKRLQEILGEIHDCDVWIATLPGFLSGDPDGPDRAGAAGIRGLIGDRRARREVCYHALVAEWDACAAVSLWDRLRRVLPPGEGPHGDGREEGAAPDFPVSLPASLASLPTAGGAHARQVTRVALVLFDRLGALHGYGAPERRLLAYAGLLHDIGWAGGRRGHHIRSCAMILADTSLPVTDRERTIVALVARFHRKAVPGSAGDRVANLPRKDRDCVLRLASLLRIADGLDYTQQGRTVGLTCTAGRTTVTCRPVFSGDGSAERARAIRKSDLFVRQFRRDFVIP